MALSIYVGPPGSGKTYNAVESVAVPAAKSGRTVLTNIKGIKPEVWADELGCDPASIIVVNDDWFKDEHHYPRMGDPELLVGGIPAGALVLIDEAYTVFPTDKDAVTARMIEWVRTHRHFVAEDGTATDLVLISQDVMSIHARVRSVVEYVSAVRNLRHIGFGKRFRVNVFSSWRMNKSTAIGQSFHKYDRKIFRLYKSFEAEGAAKVVFTDKKQRAFKAKHAAFLALIIGLLGYAATGIDDARNALDAKAVSNPATASSLLAGPTVVSNAAPQNLPCSAVGGVIIDYENGKAFYGSQWHSYQSMEDGSLDLGICIERPGTGG
jgi:zona occludens toxin